MPIIKILILVGLIRLLVATNKPMMCAGIYTGIAVLFSLMFGRPAQYYLFAPPIIFGCAFLYFWLLDRFEGTGWFWLILVLGLLIGLV